MNVKELLSLKEFQDYEVICGEQGLKNEVRAVTVMDALDIRNWVKGGEVLLTSGYAVFTWMNSTNEFRAYYFISAILGAVSLIQCIKTWMGMLGCRQEGSGALFLP